ncbi:MAG TPA: hypothetical protein VFZ41_04950 [Solirubrobacterales bacterium]
MTPIRAKTALAAALAAVLVIAATATAATIGIYRNSMQSQGLRGQVVKLVGERCGRGGSGKALRVVVGKRTRECAYRTPVIGRDLEVQAVARLLSGTPKQLRHGAYLAVNLRAGRAGAHYQLAVYPLQRKAQLRKTLSNGRVKYLHVEKNVRSVKGVNRANELRLRAFNVTRGPEKGSCRIAAFVGRRRVANVVDTAAGDLEGRASGFGIGRTAGGAKGLVASFDDVVVRVPNPFE